GLVRREYEGQRAVYAGGVHVREVAQNHNLAYNILLVCRVIRRHSINNQPVFIIHFLPQLCRGKKHIYPRKCTIFFGKAEKCARSADVLCRKSL
ncbi:MAG: hypothetical protein ACI4J8_06060, partial [Oscillospiraceae bacterium]